MHLEREACTTALSDLSAAIERPGPVIAVAAGDEPQKHVPRRRHDVNQGEDFENWRYDIALEATPVFLADWCCSRLKSWIPDID